MIATSLESLEVGKLGGIFTTYLLMDVQAL